jgi:hypothetical protein
MNVINQQIKLIEEKEKTLTKAKDKYKEVLTKLEVLNRSK